MFTKILIANRGEIACRVAATARRMAIKTVAVYSDADEKAKHVFACDQSVHIGASAPKDSYLRWEKIIAAALATGAQAIHPGYGFLSENEAFAQACKDAGLVFIGPPTEAIKAMGLKAQSKQLMAQAGVPLVPGYHEADQNPTLLQSEANTIGYPVLIKASAGGGGKGMRIVDKAADFPVALESCKREATNSFADDAVLIEKYLQQPRHIEIQVFGDTHGNYVYLFERDCSVQRRHQKVLEEAPAPGMTEVFRRQMGEAAVAAARAVSYVGAGTVEFIVEQKPDGSMQFFFMEMNTRLQVEHPVTEAITGLDLVEWQLRVASGEVLPLQQHQLQIQGHAIEARICAESPDNNFLPATGLLQVVGLPDCSAFERRPFGVRVDSGVREGDTISPFYDSMLTKIIVHGATRQEALARLDMALSQTHIIGLATNVQFLRYVLGSPSFSMAKLDTGLIPREAAVLFKQDRVGLQMACAAMVAHVLRVEQALACPPDQSPGWQDPWTRSDSWSLQGESVRTFFASYFGQRHTLQFIHQRSAGMQLRLQGQTWPFRYSDLANGSIEVCLGAERILAQVYQESDAFHVFTNQGATQIEWIDPLSHAGEVETMEGCLTAPMPGKVLSFAVGAGDKVTKGQVLAVMEAMKMEHTIASPVDGTVAELLFNVGEQVQEGAELLKLVI